jgi:type III secretion protein Q
MTALALRGVNALAHTRSQTVRRWQRGGHCAGVGRPEGAGGFLRFSAQGEQGAWQGLIMARDWLHHSLPQLPLLLAVECPATSIAGLFRAVPRPLVIEVDELHYQHLSDVELIEPSCLPAQELPWLDTSRGRLWFTLLPPECPASGAQESWLTDLPMHLELRLGVSDLSCSGHLRLGVGDVLRITRLTHQCLLADCAIGVFTFTEEGLHMELTVADSSEQDVVELDHLPVRLEFVLATHAIELGALKNIIAGQLIPLAADVAQHIEVRANGKRVARGELVQLDERLGVELLEVYRNTGDE